MAEDGRAYIVRVYDRALSSIKDVIRKLRRLDGRGTSMSSMSSHENVFVRAYVLYCTYIHTDTRLGKKLNRPFINEKIHLIAILAQRQKASR